MTLATLWTSAAAMIAHMPILHADYEASVGWVLPATVPAGADVGALTIV